MGSWNWTIASDTELSTHARVKVFDHDQPLGEDESNGNFTVRGALHVNTPNATNTVLYVDQYYNITWTKYGNIQYVNITYSNNSTSGPWKTIINNANASNQTYQWHVPDDIGNTLRVNISDSDNIAVTDVSDSDFKIVGNVYCQCALCNDDRWVVDTTRQINWTPSGNFSNISIIASTDNFTTNWTINSSVPAGPSGVMQIYNYTVEDQITRQCQNQSLMTLTQAALNYTTNTTGNSPSKATSRSPAPTLNVTWYANQTQYIEWYTNGTVSNVTIKPLGRLHLV